MYRYSRKAEDKIRAALVAGGFPADLVVSWGASGLELSSETQFTPAQKNALIAARWGPFGVTIGGNDYSLLAEEEV